MSQTVILAGGGTGGHVFPLVAVADALQKLRPSLKPVFVGTERGMETKFVPERGYELELLRVLPIRGGGVSGALRGAARAAALLPESRALLRRHAPVGVFSVGGYAAGPVSAAARTLGIPLALLEPNSIIGLANWLIAPFVQRAYTAFEITDANFAPHVVRRLGVPLRAGFQAAPYGLRAPRVRVLVLGGSQGAKALNEVLPGALARVEATLDITHQCGRAHLDDVQKRYAELGVRARVVPFIEDMQGALADADLVMSRSGAGAVSEIAAVGRPSLLIPYPFASGDHQRVNAESLQKQGAAVCVVNAEATENRLVAEITALVGDAARLEKMAAAARSAGRPNAATAVASDFLDLVGLGPSTQPQRAVGAIEPKEQ